VRARVRLSVDSRSSLHPWTPTYPAGGTAALIVTHVTWMSVLTGSNFSWLQRMIEINARVTVVALRPTSVSEGRPANRRVVQWQRAQHWRRRLTGFFLSRLTGQNEWAVLTTLKKTQSWGSIWTVHNWTNVSVLQMRWQHVPNLGCHDTEAARITTYSPSSIYYVAQKRNSNCLRAMRYTEKLCQF